MEEGIGNHERDHTQGARKNDWDNPLEQRIERAPMPSKRQMAPSPNTPLCDRQQEVFDKLAELT